MTGAQCGVYWIAEHSIHVGMGRGGRGGRGRYLCREKHLARRRVRGAPATSRANCGREGRDRAAGRTAHVAVRFLSTRLGGVRLAGTMGRGVVVGRGTAFPPCATGTHPSVFRLPTGSSPHGRGGVGHHFSSDSATQKGTGEKTRGHGSEGKGLCKGPVRHPPLMAVGWGGLALGAAASPSSRERRGGTEQRLALFWTGLFNSLLLIGGHGERGKRSEGSRRGVSGRSPRDA